MAGDTPLSHDHIKSISIVYIAFLIPSVIGSFSVLVVSLLRWRNLQEQRQLLVQLALADLLASSLLLTVTTTNITEFNADLCLYGLPLALVFYALSLILAIIYALKSRTVFQGWRSRPANCEDTQSGRTREKVFYVLLWSVFILVYLIYVCIITPQKASAVRQGAAHCNSCLLFSHVRKDGCPCENFWHQQPFYFVVFFMAVEVFLFSAVIYYKVSKWYQRQHQQSLFPVEGDGQSRRRFKHVKYIAGKMIMAIIFCWAPALLLFTLSFCIDQDKLFPLYIIQAATVSLQGFLNSMVYAWTRRNFTEAVLGERTPLIPYQHTHFFEESLRTSI